MFVSERNPTPSRPAPTQQPQPIDCGARAMAPVNGGWVPECLSGQHLLDKMMKSVHSPFTALFTRCSQRPAPPSLDQDPRAGGQAGGLASGRTERRAGGRQGKAMASKQEQTSRAKQGHARMRGQQGPAWQMQASTSTKQGMASAKWGMAETSKGRLGQASARGGNGKSKRE